MPSPFLIAAHPLRTNGYSVLPLMPRSKRPLIEKWTDYGIKAADDETFERWLKWKDSNIGVCLGVASNLVAIDLDNDIGGLHAKIESLLPPTPVAKKGAKGKTLFYQFNGQKSQGFSKDGERVLDILSQGRQTVLPPSIHPEGFPYTWLGQQTLENSPSNILPHIPLQSVYDIGKLFGNEQQPHIIQPRQVNVYDDTQKDEVSEALTYISADDYDLWIRIGMCLKEKWAESGFVMWDHWSQSSAKYKGTEMRAKWNSFRGQGVTIASLFYTAMDNGYSNSVPQDWLIEPVYEDFELNGRHTGDASAPAHTPKPALVEASATADAEPLKQTQMLTFPGALLNAPGLPGKIEEFINKTALMPQPVLALGAAIAAAGALMGRKVRSDTGLRTNFYIIGLAPSGSGKDHARTIIKRMLHDTGLGNTELGVPASSAGLISGLRDRGEGRGLILWDEFGRTLKNIASFKAGTHERDITTALIELFSSAQSIYMGKQYANHDGKSPMKPIDQPCLSVYASSVPNHFYEALSGGEAIDGFLGRWLIFESKDYTMEEEERDETICDIPQAMIDLCKYWKDHAWNSTPKVEGEGNLADTKIVPRHIPCSPEAKACLKAFNKETRKLAMQAELSGDNTGSIWSRAGEHARRLALVAHEGEEISLKVAEWAVALARFSCQYMSGAIADYVSSSELEAQTKRVLRVIKTKSKDGGWVTRADITRSFQGVPGRTRMEILGSLVERGEIIEDKMANTGGRVKLRYQAI